MSDSIDSQIQKEDDYITYHPFGDTDKKKTVLMSSIVKGSFTEKTPNIEYLKIRVDPLFPEMENEIEVNANFPVEAVVNGETYHSIKEAIDKYFSTHNNNEEA